MEAVGTFIIIGIIAWCILKWRENNKEKSFLSEEDKRIKNYKEIFANSEEVDLLAKKINSNIDKIELIELDARYREMKIISSDVLVREQINLHDLVPEQEEYCYEAYYGVEHKVFDLIIPMSEFAKVLNEKTGGAFKLEYDSEHTINKYNDGEGIDNEYVYYNSILRGITMRKKEL